MVISSKINRPTRVLKNKFAVDYQSREREENDHAELSKLVRGRLKLAVESDVDYGAMHAGEIAGLITEIKSARKIIDDIVLSYKSSSDVIHSINRSRGGQIPKTSISNTTYRSHT